MSKTFEKEGRSLKVIKNVSVAEVAKFDLKDLRDKKKELKAQLDDVQEMIDQAVLLNVPELNEPTLVKTPIDPKWIDPSWVEPVK